MLKVYMNKTVLEAARERIAYLFDCSDNVIVGFSGGKDSTVILNLALEEAERRDALPLPVLFLDQEGEWQATIDLVEDVMSDPRVEPLWLQIPFEIYNSTNHEDEWLQAWAEDEKDKWMREKHPISIKENTFGTKRFVEIFKEFLAERYPNESACYISGVRAEESPSRLLGLTSVVTGYGVTWGKVLDKSRDYYTFYPIYDWTTADVWKAIHEHGWAYNKVYDKMYQYGYSVTDMRVSNITHTDAVQHLFFLQEIEPETYVKLVERVDGIDAAGKMGKDDFFNSELPYMFADWTEYRDHLMKHLTTEKTRPKFEQYFSTLDKKYQKMTPEGIEQLRKQQVKTLILNDLWLMKIKMWERNSDVHYFRKWRQGKDGNYHSKYIPDPAYNPNLQADENTDAKESR